MTALTNAESMLLRHGLDDWLLAEAAINPDYAVSTLKSRLGGRSWPHRLMPEVPFNSITIDRKGITATLGGGPVVASVTYTQIRHWAEAVPQSLKAEIRAERMVAVAERQRTERWCRCGRDQECLESNAGDPLWGDRHHPTKSEDAVHRAILRQSRERLATLMRVALGLAAESNKQLELFEVANA